MNNSFSLSHLDSGQLEAVINISGPLRIIAGAGTGKTRTVTSRIAYGVNEGAFNPEKVMALTYTKKAATELTNRLNGYGVPVKARTIHSAALAQLSYYWSNNVGGQFPPVREHKSELLDRAAKKLSLNLDKTAFRELAAEIEWRKVNGFSIGQYSTHVEKRHNSHSVLSPEIWVDMQKEYERQKDYAKVIDFEDVLLACVGMLQNEPAALAEVHSRYKHFTVDEYQDTSPIQQKLLELWVGDSNDVAVVGDPNQSIYTFAGSTPKFLLEFDTWFPEATTVCLETNYRSGKNILELANRVLKSDKQETVQHELQNVNSTYIPKLVPADDTNEGKVTLVSYGSVEEEAATTVAKIVEFLKSGYAPQEIAVLYRVNAQADIFEKELSEKSMSAVLKGQRPFHERDEIRQVLAYIRQAAFIDENADLNKVWEEILREQFSLNSEYLVDFQPLSEDDNPRTQVLSSLKRFNQIVNEGNELKPRDFLAKFGSSNDRIAYSGVTLSTIHAAKGLEWKVVFLVGATDNLLPYRGEESDEEKRLTYVAVTRAAEELIISHPNNVEGRPQTLSRYLSTATAGVKI